MGLAGELDRFSGSLFCVSVGRLDIGCVGYEAKDGRTGNHLIGRPKIAEVERSVCRVQSPLLLAPLRRGFFFQTRRRGSHQCDLPFSRDGATCTTSVGRRIKGGTVDDNRSTLCLRTRSRSIVQMSTAEDYKQLSNRFAQLAISSSAPSVAQALLALALDYVTRATKLNQPIDGEQPAADGKSN